MEFRISEFWVDISRRALDSNYSVGFGVKGFTVLYIYIYI